MDLKLKHSEPYQRKSSYPKALPSKTGLVDIVNGYRTNLEYTMNAQGYISPARASQLTEDSSVSV